jgi:hypothetical protein
MNAVIRHHLTVDKFKVIPRHATEKCNSDATTPDVVTLYEAFRQRSYGEFSRLAIRYTGRKVFEIAWTKAGDFNSVAFEPGEWEDALREAGESELIA